MEVWYTENLLVIFFKKIHELFIPFDKIGKNQG